MPTQPARTARTGPDTREAILDAAEYVFAEKGFLGASLRDIVCRIGIAKPSLLHHFPNKSELYVAVLERIADGLREPVEACREHPDPNAGLIGLARALEGWNEHAPHGYRIVLRDMLDLTYRMSKPRQWPLEFVVEAIRETFARMRKRGPLASMGFEAFLALYLGALFHVHLERDTLAGMPYSERPADWQQRARADVTRLLEWLIDPPAQSM